MLAGTSLQSYGRYMPSLSRCPTCPHHDGIDCLPISSSGPEPCDILFLGSGPGKDEAARRMPYVGKAGQELSQLYLPLAGLHRDDTWLNGKCVHVGNASLCYDGSDRPPSEKRVVECARHHLPGMLYRVQPKVIVLMGGVTQKLITNRDRNIRLDMHHGFPQENTELLDGVWSGWVVPMYEPALGLRETTKMTPLMEDFRRLGKWLVGEWRAPEPYTGEKDYRYGDTVEEVDRYFDDCLPLSSRPMISTDTESHGSAAWSVQVSIAKHTGLLVRFACQEAMKRLAERVNELVEEGWEIEFHHSLADIRVVEKAEIRVLAGRFRDTIQEAYHICSLPQGLKPLAYRLLNVTMTSWEDTVWPASVRKFLEWLYEARAVAERDLAESIEHKLVRGRCKECGHQHSKGPCKREGCGCTSTEVVYSWFESKPGAVESILTHIARFTEAKIDDEKPYQPWKQLAKMKVGGLRGKKAEEWEWEKIRREVGEMPILGIGNCDRQQALDYACSDSDHTGQIGEELEKARAGKQWEVDKEDIDS